MSRYMEIKTFDEKESKSFICSVCGEWADVNCDRRENPWGYDTLDVNFTDKFFENYESAKDYLESTAGDYRQIAVRFKAYPPLEPSKAMVDIKRRIKEYGDRIDELNDKAHYEGVKQATVKCKCCGSSLSTKYCGSDRGLLGIGNHKGYKNECPVCGADLRPQSVIDKLKKYHQTLADLEEKYRVAKREHQKKNEKKAVIKWAVCCEVHC